MGEGREVTAGAERSDLGNPGAEVRVVDPLDESLHNLPPYTGKTLGQSVGAEEHRGSDNGDRGGIAKGDGMGSDEVHLQLGQVLRADSNVLMLPKAHVEAVDRSLTPHPLFHLQAALFDLFAA